MVFRRVFCNCDTGCEMGTAYRFASACCPIERVHAQRFLGDIAIPLKGVALLFALVGGFVPPLAIAKCWPPFRLPA